MKPRLPGITIGKLNCLTIRSQLETNLMKYIEIRRNGTQKLSTLGVLGAIALAPFFAPTPSAQAKPKDDAPAYGYRNGKGNGKSNKSKKNGGFWQRDRNDDGIDDRDTDGDGDYDRNDSTYDESMNDVGTRRNGNSNNTQGNQSITGVVTSDRIGSDRFAVRLDDGRTVEVVTRNAEPIRLTSGDRVTLRGHFDRNLFIANRVRITDNEDGNTSSGRININGVVTRDLRGNSFELRSDNGQTYRVRASNEPDNLSVGDRVQVRGDLTDGVVRASSVRILDQNNDDYNDNNGATRTINGVVTRDLSGRRFEIRASNGRTYMVTTNRAEPVRLTVGDRVQVQGRFNNDRTTFLAVSVRITQDDDVSDSGQGSQVDFRGTVVSVQSNTRLIVRGNNGRTYTVDTTNGINSAISVGDQVQVSGYGSARNVSSATVSLLRDSGTAGYGKSVEFNGIITKIGQRRGILTVKATNGKTYQVSAINNSDFGVGERVRVVGTSSNGVVTASSVTLR